MKIYIIFAFFTVFFANSEQALQCKCQIKSKARVVGGDEATPNDYPWMVSLGIYQRSSSPWFRQFSRFSHFCGATIVNKRWILTAGHCVSNRKASEVSAAVGAHDLRDIKSDQVYEVEKIFHHPDYSPNYGMHLNDMTLLKLKRDIQFVDKIIEPACLPKTALNTKVVTIAGWGQFGAFLGSPMQLHEVDVDVVDLEVCKNSWRNVFGRDTEIAIKNAICVSRRNKGACYGDSGGPLMATYKGKTYVVGATSKGYMCTGAKPDIYEQILPRLKWIQKTAGEHCE